ncbi:unnamed protein product [Linum tenue]|uniref:RRM domain-containing protein n=1 Tax=Linum tenue TaxID=586396 RepID=A0AAV0IJ10_9ROSI|nr:unnamed protein product [Linum tenue]
MSESLVIDGSDSRFQSHHEQPALTNETDGVIDGTQMANESDRNQQAAADSGELSGDRPHQMSFDKASGFVKDMNNLVEMLSKLNPMAQEFVPPSLAANNHGVDRIGYTRNFGMFGNFFDGNGDSEKRGKPNFNQGRRRTNGRRNMAQREDVIKRTVYVADIDQQVTEEQLAGLFIHCGQVVDCRICGDPNSVLRFAFVEFTDEEGAIAALSLSGTVLGYYPLKVLPSKTAIAPVNPTFLPRSEDEREMCARTVYCTNIDKKVNLGDVRLFFESSCGEVCILCC